MGSCNCGHLAQTLTRLPKEEIHRMALERAGDWGEQAREYCSTSGFPMDHVLAVLFDAGLSRDDIWHFERLSDPRVLRRLPLGERHLDHRRRRGRRPLFEDLGGASRGSLAGFDRRADRGTRGSSGARRGSSKSRALHLGVLVT